MKKRISNTTLLESPKFFMLFILMICVRISDAQIMQDIFDQRMPKPISKIISGSLLPLSGHTVCVKLICDSMLIEGLTEEGYIERMVWYYDSKKVGKGYEWKQKWTNFRFSFENSFLSSLAVTSSGSNVKWTKDSLADYVFRVHVTTLLNQATMRDEDENASIAEQMGTITVLHSFSTVNNRSGEQICMLSCDNIPGGPSFDDCQRVLGCFNRLGEELGKMVMKKYK
jgi:hypothetical protein